MPTPRITGLLNNCALNSALPTLIDGIGHLAQLEESGGLEFLTDNVIINHYRSLKNIYASYYGIKDTPDFTWKAFHSFITAHSFYANEIMFAPILRSFIAEIGLTNGYARSDLWLLRDIQDEDGRYNYLHYLEAANLFHGQFGISLRTYEYVAEKNTGNPKDNYNLINTRASSLSDYPFGTAPTVELYFRGEHFEIQPHESLADANREFVHEINTLPASLAAIHEGLSTSETAHRSNAQLAQLVVYGHNALQSHLEKMKNKPVAPIQLPSPPVGLPPQPTRKEDRSPTHQAYLISAQDYAANGRAFHAESSEGRQTLAVILLTILIEKAQERASFILANLDTLSNAAQNNKPLASYLLDKLTTAIIESRADIQSPRVREVLDEIESNRLAVEQMRSIEQSNRNETHVRLIKKAQETIKQLWQLYKETKDASLISVIKQTQLIAIAPSQENLTTYNEFREQINGKGSLGKVISGLMLAVLGLALIVAGALCFAGSLGLGSPVSLPVIATGASLIVSGAGSIAGGIAFFKSGQDSLLHKQMKETSNEAQSLSAPR